MRGIHSHLRSNMVAYIALFVALGGTSYAAINLPAGQRRHSTAQEPCGHGGEAESDERRSERTCLGDPDVDWRRWSVKASSSDIHVSNSGAAKW